MQIKIQTDAATRRALMRHHTISCLRDCRKTADGTPTITYHHFQFGLGAKGQVSGHYVPGNVDADHVEYAGSRTEKGDPDEVNKIS